MGDILRPSMRPLVLILVAASLPLAGCVGNAEGQEDPFAYMSKPLYASAFSLDAIGDGTDFQEFRLVDGSVVYVDLYVWINATQGSATVTFTNPSGHVEHTFTQTGMETVQVELGVWRVDIAGHDAPSGHVHVKAVRG